MRDELVRHGRCREIALDRLDEAAVTEYLVRRFPPGSVLVSATSYWQSNLAFATMLMLAAMAAALFGLMDLGKRLVCPWYAGTGQRADPAAAGR